MESIPAPQFTNLFYLFSLYKFLPNDISNQGKIYPRLWEGEAGRYPYCCPQIHQYMPLSLTGLRQTYHIKISWEVQFKLILPSCLLISTGLFPLGSDLF